MDGLMILVTICVFLLVIAIIVIDIKLQNMVKAKIGYKMKVSKGEATAMSEFIRESKTKILKLEQDSGKPDDGFAIISNELSLYWDDDGMLWHEIVPRVKFTDNIKEFNSHKGLEVPVEVFIKGMLKQVSRINHDSKRDEEADQIPF